MKLISSKTLALRKTRKRLLVEDRIFPKIKRKSGKPRREFQRWGQPMKMLKVRKMEYLIQETSRKVVSQDHMEENKV